MKNYNSLSNAFSKDEEVTYLKKKFPSLSEDELTEFAQEINWLAINQRKIGKVAAMAKIKEQFRKFIDQI